MCSCFPRAASCVEKKRTIKGVKLTSSAKQRKMKHYDRRISDGYTQKQYKIIVHPEIFNFIPWHNLSASVMGCSGVPFITRMIHSPHNALAVHQYDKKTYRRRLRGCKHDHRNMSERRCKWHCLEAGKILAMRMKCGAEVVYL